MREGASKAGFAQTEGANTAAVGEDASKGSSTTAGASTTTAAAEAATGVASVNGTEYNTITTAVAAANAGETVTITARTTERVVVNKAFETVQDNTSTMVAALHNSTAAWMLPANKQVTLALAGNTISGAGTVAGVVAAAGGSTVKNTGGSFAKAPTGGEGTVTITGGTFDENGWDSGEIARRLPFSACSFTMFRRLRGVAQFGSAIALGAMGRWFESSRPDHVRVWFNGRTSAFQADDAGSTPVTRSTGAQQLRGVEISGLHSFSQLWP